ncbi:hypothetical protein Slin14017_G122170 [Septoria linicola]|nr:hypothetical protein Slin14017_G122170 [Septoria linicola]
MSMRLSRGKKAMQLAAQHNNDAQDDMARLRIEDLVRRIDTTIQGDLAQAVALFRQLWRWIAAEMGTEASAPAVAASISTRFPRNEGNFRSRLATILITTLSAKAQRHANRVKAELPWGMDLLDFSCLFGDLHTSDRALHALRLLAKHEEDFGVVIQHVHAQALMRRSQPRKAGQNNKTREAEIAFPDLEKALAELCARTGDPAPCKSCTAAKGEWGHGKKKTKKQSLASPKQLSLEPSNAEEQALGENVNVEEQRSGENNNVEKQRSGENINVGEQTPGESINAAVETPERFPTVHGAEEPQDSHGDAITAAEASEGRAPEKGRRQNNVLIDDEPSFLGGGNFHNSADERIDDETFFGGGDQSDGAGEKDNDTVGFHHESINDTTHSQQHDSKFAGLPADPQSDSSEDDDDDDDIENNTAASITPSVFDGGLPAHLDEEVDRDAPHFDFESEFEFAPTATTSHHHTASNSIISTRTTTPAPPRHPKSFHDTMSTLSQTCSKKRRRADGSELPTHPLPSVATVFSTFRPLVTKNAPAGNFPPQLSLQNASGAVVCVAIELDKETENWGLAIVDRKGKAIESVAEDADTAARVEAIVVQQLPLWLGRIAEDALEMTRTTRLFSGVFPTTHHQCSRHLTSMTAILVAFDVVEQDTCFLPDLWAEIFVIYDSFLTAPADTDDEHSFRLAGVLDAMIPAPTINLDEDLEYRLFSPASVAVLRTDCTLQHSRQQRDLLVKSTANIKVFTLVLQGARDAAATATSNLEQEKLREQMQRCRATLASGCSAQLSRSLQAEVEDMKQQLSLSNAKGGALARLGRLLGDWRLEECRIEFELKDKVKENTQKARDALRAALQELDHA